MFDTQHGGQESRSAKKAKINVHTYVYVRLFWRVCTYVQCHVLSVVFSNVQCYVLSVVLICMYVRM